MSFGFVGMGFLVGVAFCNWVVFRKEKSNYDSRGRLCCDVCRRPYHANGYEKCNCAKGW